MADTGSISTRKKETITSMFGVEPFPFNYVRNFCRYNFNTAIQKVKYTQILQRAGHLWNDPATWGTVIGQINEKGFRDIAMGH